MPKTYKPTLIISSGLTGAGKTTTLRILSKEIDNSIYLDKDTIAKTLLGNESYFGAYYAKYVREQSYKVMLQLARDNLALGKVVILDGYFGVKLTTGLLKGYLDSNEFETKIIHFACSCETLRIRVIKRGDPRDNDKLQNFDVYYREHDKKHREGLATVPYLEINTENEQSLENNIQWILDYTQSSSEYSKKYFVNKFELYNRFNIHTVGQNLKPEILAAEKFIIDNGQKNEDQFKNLYLQIGSYYLFYERDLKKSLYFLEKHQALVAENKDSFECGMCLSLIGHAYTIDASYHDADIFAEASAIFSSYPQKKDIKEWIIFSDMFENLMKYRKSYLLKNITPEEAINIRNVAIDGMGKVIAMAEAYAATGLNPFSFIDIAHCKHLRAVMHIKNKNLLAAKDDLLDALKLEHEFRVKTGTPFFLEFTTMQSLADVWRLLGIKENNIAYLKESEHLLLEAHMGQIKVFGCKQHADIAKTLHFLGNTYVAMNNETAALNYYAKALCMKVAILGKTNPVVNFTIEEIEKLVKIDDAIVDALIDNPESLGEYFGSLLKIKCQKNYNVASIQKGFFAEKKLPNIIAPTEKHQPSLSK